MTCADRQNGSDTTYSRAENQRHSSFTINYKLTRDDIDHINKLLTLRGSAEDNGATIVSSVFLGIFVLALLTSNVFIGMRNILNGVHEQYTVFLLLIVIIVVAYARIFRSGQTPASVFLRSAESMGIQVSYQNSNEIVIILSQKGIQYVSHEESLSIPWKEVTAVEASSLYFYLWLTIRRRVIAIPRNAFTSSDQEKEFQKLLGFYGIELTLL